jgi:hypothetical protein
LKATESSKKSSVGKSKKRKYTKYEQILTQFIVKTSLPFSIVEDELFIKLVTYFEKSYQPPSRSVLAGPLLDIEYDNTINSIKCELRDVNFVCLTLDGCRVVPQVTKTQVKSS